MRDVEERLGSLQTVPDERALPPYHPALKSTATTIEAAALSEEARFLEEAGKKGDTAAIRQGLYDGLGKIAGSRL
jgi:hypothetical protein